MDEEFKAEIERITVYYDAERERINREAARHLKNYFILVGVAVVLVVLCFAIWGLVLLLG